MSDYYNVIDTAAEEAEKRGRTEGRAEGLVEGRAEGIEIGRSEGIEEGVRITAKNMKQLGVSVDIIAQSTGLSREVIETL